MESSRWWTGEQRRAEDLAECGLVGEQFGLGAVLDVEHRLGGTRYLTVARLCSAAGGLTVLGAVVLGFTRYGESLWVLVLAGIVGGAAVAITRARPSGMCRLANFAVRRGPARLFRVVAVSLGECRPGRPASCAGGTGGSPSAAWPV